MAFLMRRGRWQRTTSFAERMTGIMWGETGLGQNQAMLTMAPAPETPAPAAVRPTLSWKSVGLPIEHGGWSFLVEPLILGLVVAPSLAGASLAVSATAAFLARHPFKLVVLDRRRGVRYPRTGLAERFFSAYATIAASAFTFALWLGGAAILTPLVAAAPLALLALGRDLQGRGREALPEVAGALGLGASATAIILAGGGVPATAWLAWALGAARAATAILYVRARVRVDRGVDGQTRAALARPVMVVHAGALVLALVALRAAWLPPIAASAFLLLLLRAVHGLAPGCAPIRAQVLGIQEVLVGAACLYLFAAGLA